MDIKKYSEKITHYLKKYRYAVLILLIGLALMLLPERNQEVKSDSSQPETTQAYAFENIAEELKQILSQIEGVGQVEVMLTVSASEQMFYQTDEDHSVSDSGSTIRKETVIITGDDRQEEALLSYVQAPVYKGAIIVCKGGGDAAVKLAIIDAVSKITGLSSDKISVVKMK